MLYYVLGGGSSLARLKVYIRLTPAREISERQGGERKVKKGAGIKYLKENERMCIYLQVLGFSQGEACKKVGVEGATRKWWRKTKPEYVEVEDEMVREKEKYRGEAKEAYREWIGFKVSKIADDIIDKGKEWEGLDKEGRSMLLKVMELWMKFGQSKPSLGARGRGKKGGEGAYEDYILTNSKEEGNESTDSEG